MQESTENRHVPAPEGMPSFRTAVRGYARPAVDDAVVGLSAQCAFLKRLSRDLEEELAEVEKLLVGKQSSQPRATADSDDCSELTAMIEGILRPARADARQAVAEADLARTSACAEAEAAANALRESTELECARLESDARAQAEQMLAAAREYAEHILAAAAARESGADQESAGVVREIKRAMIAAAADQEIAITARSTEQTAEIQTRQAQQDKWLHESQLVAEEAEQLSVSLPEEAQREAQEILDCAQEQITALVEQSALGTEFLEQQVELRCAELREHMEAIADGIGSLGERLRGGVPPVSTYDWYSRRGVRRGVTNRRPQRLSASAVEAAQTSGDH